MERSGQHLPWDATEPRLWPELDKNGPENVMAVCLSHVPPCVRYGIWAQASGNRESRSMWLFLCVSEATAARGAFLRLSSFGL